MLSEELIQLFNDHYPPESEEESVFMLTFIFEWCMEYLGENIGYKNGVRNKEVILREIRRLNNILNIVKEATDHDLYDFNPLQEEIISCLKQ